jgi:hypothetical protein
LRTYFTDDYFKNPAKQLHSSLFENETLFAPYQDNRWSASLKMNYDVSNKQKLAFTYLRSFSINQDMNNLRITGNDVPYLPGYPFLFSQQNGQRQYVYQQFQPDGAQLDRIFIQTFLLQSHRFALVYQTTYRRQRPRLETPNR